MAEQAIANGDEAVVDDVGGDGGSESESTEPSPRRWAIRGAAVGAVAGSAVGAAIGILIARRPDALEQAKGAISGSGGQVARAAAVAATEVVTSRRLNQLMVGNGNGDPSRAMKETARAWRH